MGMEKYEWFVRRAKGTLTYDPGWSLDNRTGAWRAERPVIDRDVCNNCGICWLYCPDGVITRDGTEIDLDYCKGCGICKAVCARGAIDMEREEA